MIDVVAALIFNNNKLLICQRPIYKARGLLWEFIGGKAERNETMQEALIRQVKEEIDVSIEVKDIFINVKHEYSDIVINLTVFNASIIEGSIEKLEHNDIKWIDISEIDNYEFCPADIEITKKIKSITNIYNI